MGVLPKFLPCPKDYLACMTTLGTEHTTRGGKQPERSGLHPDCIRASWSLPGTFSPSNLHLHEWVQTSYRMFLG